MENMFNNQNKLKQRKSERTRDNSALHSLFGSRGDTLLTKLRHYKFNLSVEDGGNEEKKIGS